MPLATGITPKLRGTALVVVLVLGVAAVSTAGTHRVVDAFASGQSTKIDKTSASVRNAIQGGLAQDSGSREILAYAISRSVQPVHPSCNATCVRDIENLVGNSSTRQDRSLVREICRRCGGDRLFAVAADDSGDYVILERAEVLDAIVPIDSEMDVIIASEGDVSLLIADDDWFVKWWEPIDNLGCEWVEYYGEINRSSGSLTLLEKEQQGSGDNCY